MPRITGKTVSDCSSRANKTTKRPKMKFAFVSRYVLPYTTSRAMRRDTLTVERIM